ncbi:MAG: hypothetical protein E7A62_07660 [Actinomycetaceae bacterium]|nr:hypothetical protein [Actinomycetaceae bacterium]MDU0970852.1 hypothetical protein [Actinomycetaceae bacterium]
MSLTEQEKARLSTGNGAGPNVSYLVRRETHSARAVAATLMAVLALIIAVYLALEGILEMCGQKALLARPTAIWDEITALPKDIPWLAVIIGVAIALVGLVFLIKSIAPGTLGRHQIVDERAAYIVDDSVIASAISRKVREHANLSAGQVHTSVSRKSIDVTAEPTSGLTLDEAELRSFLEQTVSELHLKPAPHVGLKISNEGQVAE